MDISLSPVVTEETVTVYTWIIPRESRVSAEFDAVHRRAVLTRAEATRNRPHDRVGDLMITGHGTGIKIYFRVQGRDD